MAFRLCASGILAILTSQNPPDLATSIAFFKMSPPTKAGSHAESANPVLPLKHSASPFTNLINFA